MYCVPSVPRVSGRGRGDTLIQGTQIGPKWLEHGEQEEWRGRKERTFRRKAGYEGPGKPCRQFEFKIHLLISQQGCARLTSAFQLCVENGFERASPHEARQEGRPGVSGSANTVPS